MARKASSKPDSGTSQSSATIGFEAKLWLTGGTAMRGSTMHSREAILRCLSEAKDNSEITHHDPFAERFLKKCDHMVTCIDDDDDGNGFVWHTTGSGKTLTSFKASTLLKENDHIHKCVFVVDRQQQTRHVAHPALARMAA